MLLKDLEIQNAMTLIHVFFVIVYAICPISKKNYNFLFIYL